MNPITETPRLLFREFSEADAPGLFELNSDPEVIRFTGNAPFTSVREALQFVNNYDQYRLNNFGRWALINKSNSEFIGWCGLRRSEDNGETDIGYRLLKRYWGKGLATEAAIESIRLGFEVHDLKAIVGRTMSANQASIRILEKTGMSFRNTIQFENEPGLVYQIDKQQYEQQLKPKL